MTRFQSPKNSASRLVRGLATQSGLSGSSRVHPTLHRDFQSPFYSNSVAFSRNLYREFQNLVKCFSMIPPSPHAAAPVSGMPVGLWGPPDVACIIYQAAVHFEDRPAAELFAPRPVAYIPLQWRRLNSSLFFVVVVFFSPAARLSDVKMLRWSYNIRVIDGGMVSTTC